MSASVRLKIPVGPSLAKKLAELAECVGESQSWIAAQMLAAVVEENQYFAGWVYWRVVNGAVAAMQQAGDAVAAFRGLKLQALEETDQFIQAYVSPQLAADVCQLGRTMNFSEADAASRLLYCAVESESWIVKAINSRLSRRLLKGMGVKPAANMDGNQEPKKNRGKVTHSEAVVRERSAQVA